ncbi:MAG: hypothetical protein IJB73_03640 [Firmicutes bacterium]|nr:hypothetical protein [Bacillota bacterium]
MKNLIIIIGTILLGAIIVNTLVLGDDNSLKSTAGAIMEEGNKAIMDSITFGGGQPPAGSGETTGGV